MKVTKPNWVEHTGKPLFFNKECSLTLFGCSGGEESQNSHLQHFGTSRWYSISHRWPGCVDLFNSFSILM